MKRIADIRKIQLHNLLFNTLVSVSKQENPPLRINSLYESADMISVWNQDNVMAANKDIRIIRTESAELQHCSVKSVFLEVRIDLGKTPLYIRYFIK